MNIDKMIVALSEKPEVLLGQFVVMNPKTAEEIISLLEAVRALRGSIGVTLNVGQQGYTEVLHIIDSEATLRALAAYDEITKEKV